MDRLEGRIVDAYEAGEKWRDIEARLNVNSEKISKTIAAHLGGPNRMKSFDELNAELLLACEECDGDIDRIVERLRKNRQYIYIRLRALGIDLEGERMRRQVRAAAESWERTGKVAAVAAELGVCDSNVRKLLHRAGVAPTRGDAGKSAAKARALRAEGRTTSEIAEIMGVSTSYVSMLTRPTGRRNRPRAENEARARALRAEGRTASETAEIIGRSKSYVYALTKRSAGDPAGTTSNPTGD